MKDPLRYFIDEGFGHIFYWRADDGRYNGTIRWATGFKYVPVHHIVDGQSVIDLANVRYPVCDKFFLEYGSLTPSSAKAQELVEEYNRQWIDIRKELSTVNFDSIEN
jgi:hypothetical protein